MTSPGRSALQEAARLEAARFYGQPCREQRGSLILDAMEAECAALEVTASDDKMIASALREGIPVEDIVVSYCVDRTAVRAVQKRIMRTGAA